LSGTFCLSSCAVRLFLQNETCTPCPYDCFTCDLNANCLACNSFTDFRVLNPTINRCVPIDGYFDNKVSVSVLCPANCSLCQSFTVCSKCSNGYLGPNQLCGDCPPRYYSNNQTRTCVKCPYDCFTCDGNNGCLSCSSADMRTLSNSRCVANQGYYSDGINSLCLPCPFTCKSCNSSSFCAACKPGYFLDLTNQCIENCGVRQFINITAFRCQSCPYDCYTCDTSGFCLSCNGTNDFRTLNSNTKRCVPSVGFYESYITVSAPCPTCCATCVSANRCTSCLPNCFLNLNLSCLTSCPDRFFKNTRTGKCSACPYDCLTCDSN